MIDLSKHIQEGARLELEAMERTAEECSFCSSMSAQHSAQAMRIDELQAEIHKLRLAALTWYKRVHDLEDEIANWKSWGVIEVAIRNPNVSSSMKHWEERAEKAESDLAAANALLKCPIGLDSSPEICSAGTCPQCLGRRLAAANARAAHLQSIAESLAVLIVKSPQDLKPFEIGAVLEELKKTQSS